MKKLISLIIIAVLLALNTAVYAAAESEPGFVLTADKNTVLPGDEITFTLSGTGFSGAEGLQLYLVFDENAFHAAAGNTVEGSVRIGTSLIEGTEENTGWSGSMAVSKRPGRLLYVAYRSLESDVSETPELLPLHTFTLTVDENADVDVYDISFDIIEVCDSSANKISCSDPEPVTVNVVMPIPPYQPFKFRLEDENAVITGYEPEDEIGDTLTVPEEVDVYRVAGIDSGAFSSFGEVKSINLPSGLAQLEPGAFDGMTSLESYSVAEGNANFKAVSGLLYSTGDVLISCPKALGGEFIVPENTVGIGQGAFKDCTSIESLTLPEKLTAIADGAFSGCTNLSEITVPPSVTDIADDAFENCSESLTICGYRGTAAENYASSKGITFECLDKDEDVLKGDIDFNGTVNVSDILALKNLIMTGSWTDEQLMAGDINEDSNLNVSDILAIKNIIMSA